MDHTPPPINGAHGNVPNGPQLIKRKKQQNDPFFSTKKGPAVLRKTLVNGRPAPTINGSLAPATQLGWLATPNSQRSTSPSKHVVPDSERVSGFSDPRVTAESIPYKDYKLVTSKRELLDGRRFHLLQLPGDKPIDIRNEAEFSKPARLHRRDPRAAPPGQMKEETEDPRDGLNQEEREELNKRKEVRQKEREANLAQVAPSQGSSRKLNNFKKKTQQVFKPDYTEEDKRRIVNNYEEKLPWHLEDFDNKHCFVGQNQLASGRAHAAFVYDPTFDPSSQVSSGRFKLLPVEKLYHFRQKRDSSAQMMTIEEVEQMMKKRAVEPEWLTRTREARMAETMKDMQAKKSKGLFSGAQNEMIAGRTGEDADMDFDADEMFADDEEGDLFIDRDEDEKLAEKKIKEDQLKANFLDFKDEKDYDHEEDQEKKEAEARKKNFKDIRRALEKRERNYNHGSDSEDSLGSSSGSEEERERLEKEKLANLNKEDPDGKTPALPSSGANTPSGRREKHASDREGGLKISNSSKSLKRPGSPNLSEASGTDTSSRKKKKHRHLSSSQPTPQPSRPISPANVPSSSAAPLSNGQLDPSSALSSKPPKKRTNIPGAGSDTEAAQFSDSAMSDGSKAKRIKLNVKDPGGTSPKVLTPQGGSRATSPKPQTAPAATQAPKSDRMPTPEEILAVIPPEGLTIKEFVGKVSHPTERRKELIQLVRTVARFDKETGLLRLK